MSLTLLRLLTTAAGHVRDLDCSVRILLIALQIKEELEDLHDSLGHRCPQRLAALQDIEEEKAQAALPESLLRANSSLLQTLVQHHVSQNVCEQNLADSSEN